MMPLPQPPADPAGGHSRRRLRALLPWLLLLGPAAVLRLIGISTTGVWHDEAMSIHTARMGFFEQLVDMAVANNQPPLYFLLLKLWAVVTWWPVWLRLFSVVLSLVGVVYAVRWIRLWDRRAGWLAGLLAATSPLMVHYAQEIRAYALLYTCLLAGLYYGERLAREGSRPARVGLLICTSVMSCAHFTGLLTAAALWVYTCLRGTGLRRTAITACAWLAVMVPVISLGLYHAVAKVQAGFWVPPLTVDRLVDLAASWTGHGWLTLWERAGSSIGRSWMALVGQAVLDNIDQRHKGILPEYVWGDGDAGGVNQRAAEEMKNTARAAQRLGVSVVNGFTGSSIWHLIYDFPPTPREMIDAGFDLLAERWNPILDVFGECGVKFALEVHPTEIAFDLHTAR
ncbi:MAG: TIM barrel protein, partial [Planctomycetes bacterium]|nr:TIM barrel protein [Planctomycetota bacterium]